LNASGFLSTRASTSVSAPRPLRGNDKSFTLADGEGSFIEVFAAEALRSEFERPFSDKHLSPDQILAISRAAAVASARAASRSAA
jgi:hypothetical protein